MSTIKEISIEEKRKANSKKVKAYKPDQLCYRSINLTVANTNHDRDMWTVKRGFKFYAMHYSLKEVIEKHPIDEIVSMSKG